MSNQNKNSSDDLAKNKASGGLPDKEYLAPEASAGAGKDEVVSLAKSKIVLVKKLLNNIKENNEHLIQLLSGVLSDQDEAAISISQISNGNFEPAEELAADTRTI